MVLVLIVGGFIGAAIAYLQSYFNRHDPAAGGALSVGAWFAGSAILIVWLLIDPSGILAPSLALSAALSYLLIQELCERRAESTEASDVASGRDQLRAAEAPHPEP
jgi:cobalamin biosynthesis protein CobD/CbiB